jgi:peptide/nickel transport system substrate-binding protein
MKKFVCVLGCLLVALFAVGVGAEVKNPDTFILANYGNLRTLDPSVAYDVTSSQRLWNIYQPLVFFDGSYTDKFKPLVATAVPTLENGGRCGLFV